TKRTYFVQFGMIIALLITLGAFEWKSYEKQEINLEQRAVADIAEEIIPITKQEKPPPPPEPPKQTTLLRVVEDDVVVEDIIIIDVMADDETEMEEFIPMQIEEEEIVEEKIFIVVENQPEFPGGEKARRMYLAKNIDYPQLARESGIQGTVYLTFVVEKDGSVTDVRILRGIGGGCDEEALRVVKAMPRWQAGKQRGKPVRVQFQMPIRFTLQ
ncbi:MAG: energy transducer TonB, partial [Bacteroidota bacterium]|nr:energy transducer TonB [Bacteroidota bacterium]